MRNYLPLFIGLVLVSGNAFADELLLSCNEQFEFCVAGAEKCEQLRQECTEPTGPELLAQTEPQIDFFEEETKNVAEAPAEAVTAQTVTAPAPAEKVVTAERSPASTAKAPEAKPQPQLAIPSIIGLPGM